MCPNVLYAIQSHIPCCSSFHIPTFSKTLTVTSVDLLSRESVRRLQLRYRSGLENL